MPRGLEDKLARSPWPGGERPVIFLIDASNGVERDLLDRWIERHRGDRQPPRVVEIDLSDDRKPLVSHPLAMALAENPDAIVAPLRVAWTPSKRAIESGPRLIDLIRGGERRPGIWQARLILRTSPYRTHLVNGEPASVADLNGRFRGKYQRDGLEHPDDLAVFVARQAVVVLDMVERKLQGGRYKVPRYVTQSLRSNLEFRHRLEAICAAEGRSLDDAYAEVDTYFKEMISVPTSFWLDVWAKFCNFCLGLGYDTRLRYNPADLERIRAVVRDKPAALLWTHKTYLDGFVVPKIMFDNNFPMPHMFGGANLNIPGLGFLLRRAGGIFIKRSFTDNEVYKATLRQYIAYLMEKRFPLTWSFEGTRSRLGKLMPPKYGLLKYVLEACHHSGAQDIHIIPVTVTYDLIRDAEEYAREQGGVPKAPESLSWLVGYIRSLARPMGKIYVDFGEPVVLAQSPDPEDSLALSKIAFQVAVEANRVTPVTFPSLVSMVLLGSYPRALTEEEIIWQVDRLMHWAEARNIRRSPDFERSYAENIDDLLGIMIDEGIITRFDGGPQTVYGIAEGQAPVASYYRNTIVHYFVNQAIAELALVRVVEAGDSESAAEALFWSEVEELRDLFKFEFFYPTSDVFRAEIEAEMARIEPDWQAYMARGPAGSRHLLRELSPYVSHMTLQMFAEAYSLAADLLAGWEESDTMAETECVDRCMSYGKQAYLQRRVGSEASVGKLLFRNAWKTLAARRLVDASLPAFREARQAQADALTDLVRRIEVVRASSISSRGNMTTRDRVRGAV